MHRLKRLLDLDRSGTVEVAEVADLMREERVYRIDKLLFAAFCEHGVAHDTDGDPFHIELHPAQFGRVLEQLYGSAPKVPTSVLEAAMRKWGRGVLFKPFRNWLLDLVKDVIGSAPPDDEGEALEPGLPEDEAEAEDLEVDSGAGNHPNLLASSDNLEGDQAAEASELPPENEEGDMCDE